jgi:hypothetical protein
VQRATALKDNTNVEADIVYIETTYAIRFLTALTAMMNYIVAAAKNVTLTAQHKTSIATETRAFL